MKLYWTTLFAITACSSGDDAQDLGAFASGKADVQTIRVPLRLDASETLPFTLSADGPFDVVTTYDQPVVLDLSATDGATQQFHAAGVQPTLFVDAAQGAAAAWELTVINTSAAPIRGTLEIRDPAPRCADDLWKAWFDTLTTRLAAAGSFIEPSEKAAIDAVVAAQPCTPVSDDAYGYWLHDLDQRLASFGSFIEPNEQAFLDIVLPIRPVSVGGPSYLAWLPAFNMRLLAAGGFIEPNEQIVLDLLLGARPISTAESAYLAWLPPFADRIAAAGSFLEPNEVAAIGLQLTARPIVTSDAAYVAWMVRFRPVVLGIGSFLEPNERTILETLISGKPCASGADAVLAWNELAASAPSAAADLVQSSQPGAGCGI